jgi:preprotein translocase subunit SecG
VTAVLSALQVLLAIGVGVLVLMHSGKDSGLSGAFGMAGGQASYGGTAVMERNLTRMTIVLALIFAANSIGLGFLL